VSFPRKTDHDREPKIDIGSNHATLSVMGGMQGARSAPQKQGATSQSRVVCKVVIKHGKDPALSRSDIYSGRKPP
jgi:hypothetical protein